MAKLGSSAPCTLESTLILPSHSRHGLSLNSRRVAVVGVSEIRREGHCVPCQATYCLLLRDRWRANPSNLGDGGHRLLWALPADGQLRGLVACVVVEGDGVQALGEVHRAHGG